MIIWPFGCVERQGYGIDHARDKVQQVYQGNPFGRRTSRAPNHFFNFSHHFTREQLVEFDVFYEQTLQGGLLPFVVEYMEDGHGQGAREIMLIGERKPSSTPEGIGYRLNFRAVWRRDVELITDAAPPVASFTFTESAGSVSFTDTSTDDIGVVSWLWDFGDDTTSTEQNPNKTYAFGSYTITLEVTDAAGNASQDTQDITIAYQEGWIDFRGGQSSLSIGEYDNNAGDLLTVYVPSQITTYAAPVFDADGMSIRGQEGVIFPLMSIDQNDAQSKTVKFIVKGAGDFVSFALHWEDTATRSDYATLYQMMYSTSSVYALGLKDDTSSANPRYQDRYFYGQDPKASGLGGFYGGSPEWYPLSSEYIRFEFTNSGKAGGFLNIYQLTAAEAADDSSWDAGVLIQSTQLVANVPTWGIVRPAIMLNESSVNLSDTRIVAAGVFNE